MQHIAPFLRYPDRKGAKAMMKFKTTKTKDRCRELRDKLRRYGLANNNF